MLSGGDRRAGIAVSQTGYHTADEFIRDADTAHVSRQSNRKWCERVVRRVDAHGAMARLQLESDLRRAVAESQFELYYQPILNLTSGGRWAWKP